MLRKLLDWLFGWLVSGIVNLLARWRMSAGEPTTGLTWGLAI